MNQEKIIQDYFNGWETQNWNHVANQLADGFTFTSPNGEDNQLNIRQYKEACWPWPDSFKKVLGLKVFIEGNEAFVKYQIIRTNGSNVKNMEYMRFENGKIKVIEVYFGRPEESF